MPGIVEYPQVVQEALHDFDDLFAKDCQRRHFAEYLTGLSVADRKNVSGIHREFAQTTDPSCLNRFLTAADWDVRALNQRRLDLLQKDPTTRYSGQGVIALDNVLIDHKGLLIPDASWSWDHAEDRYQIAQDYLFINSVCTNGQHYPLEFRRFRPEGLCDCLGDPFEDHTELCRQLIDWACAEQIPGAFTFDSSVTDAPILNHIQSKLLPTGEPRADVGDLKFNRKLEWRGRSLKAAELAAEIGSRDRKGVRVGERRQWYFTCTVRIPEVNHKVRIVILWNDREDSEPRKILVSNRVDWEVSRILRVYRHRWTGTEAVHRDGKQQLGMGDCPLRDDQGQTRHMDRVMLASSLLMRQLGQGHAWGWALPRLTTIGEACRAMLRESLRKTLTWAITQVTQRAWSVDQVTDHLGLTGAKP